MAEWTPEQMALAAAAALSIQRHFRGFLGRRRYAARLWEVYAEEEERQRIEKEEVLVEETEILVEARKAVIDMEERETVRKYNWPIRPNLHVEVNTTPKPRLVPGISVYRL